MIVLLEAALCTFASWTLAYHFALVVALPARLVVVPFAAALLIMAVPFRQRWSKVIQQIRAESWITLGVLATSLGAGVFTLLVSRPDPDDFGFFSRALAQLHRLDLPFLTVDSTLHVAGGVQPPLPKVHVITSYEPLAALAAALAGADPLSVYQNICGLVAALLLPVVYFLLYRHFRLSRLVALLCTLAAILFLLIDGNTHRSFGSFGIVRIWQGKVVLATVLLPATLLLAHRYLSYPTPRKLGILALAGICAVGLSSSGIFLFPMFVFAISLTFLLAGRVTRTRLGRAVQVNLASFYCVAIAAGFLFGFIAEATDLGVWNTPSWPSTWWENLTLVLGDRLTVARSLMLLLALPLVGLGRIAGRFIALLSVTICALFANPLLGPLWLDALGPVVYWRLAYLFPLPWCAGLLASAVGKGGSRHWAFSAGRLVAVAAAVLVATTLRFTVLNPGTPPQQVFIKPALEYRLPPREMAFVRSVSDHLDNTVVLAPFRMVATLGLMNTSIQFEATRPSYLRYGLAGRDEADLARRIRAQNYVTLCRPPSRGIPAIRRSIELGVDAIVVQNCESGAHPLLAELETRLPGEWEMIQTNNGYTLMALVGSRSASGGPADEQ